MLSQCFITRLAWSFFFFFNVIWWLELLSVNKFGSSPWSQCVSTTGTVEYEEVQLSSVSTLEPFTLTLVQETLHVWSRLCLHLRGHRKCMWENFLCQCSNFIENFGTKSQEYYSLMKNKKEGRLFHFFCTLGGKFRKFQNKNEEIFVLII